MTTGSLIKVERIAEYCNTFDLHEASSSLENHVFGLLESGRFTQVLLYFIIQRTEELLVRKEKLCTVGQYLLQVILFQSSEFSY